MLDRLREDHRRLAALADRLEDALDFDCPDDLGDVAHARWNLARALFAHLAIEDRLIRGGGRHTPGLAEPARFRAELEDHYNRWTGDAIVRGWADYRIATLAMVATLRRRLAHEERGAVAGHA